MTQPVFLSYARRVSRSDALGLYDALGGDAEGLTFLDTEEIEHGDQFPARIVDALLAARVVVLFIEPTYFTRWYCEYEFRLACRPYLEAIKSNDRSDSGRAAAVAPLIVALGATATSRELDRLPPPVRDTNWPASQEADDIASLVKKRLSHSDHSIGELLDRTVGATAVRAEALRWAKLPPPLQFGAVPLVPVVGIPISLANGFFGRENDLFRINRALASPQRGAVHSAAPTAAIEGGAGVGKTQLAAEYLHRFGPLNYSGGVFWINAEEEIDPQLYDIIRALDASCPPEKELREGADGVSAYAARLLRRLAADRDMLAIINNVPEPGGPSPARTLDFYFPAFGSVSVLITSRMRVSAGEQGRVIALPIDVLDREAASSLLLRAMDGPVLTASELEEIADWVGRLPLALALLSGALRSGAISPKSLLGNARSAAPVAMLESLAEALRPLGIAARGVISAFDISYRALDHGAKRAAVILAHLAPAPVPEAIVDDIGPAAFGAAIRSQLQSHSIVARVTAHEGEMFGQMHRLLAEYLRAQTPDSTLILSGIAHSLHRLMRPEAIEDPQQRARLVYLLPHAHHVFQDLSVRSRDAEQTRALVILGTGAAVLARFHRMTAESVALMERTVEIARTLDESHVAYLDALDALAGMAHSLGHADRAEQLEEEAYRGYLASLGPHAQGTLQAMNTLAVMKAEVGKLDEARQLYEQLIPTLEQVFPRDERRIRANARSNLAAVVHRQLKFSEALALTRANLEDFTARYGSDDYLTLDETGSLANLLTDMGESATALPLFRTAIDGLRRILHERHRIVLGHRYNLARTVKALGDIETARDMVRSLVEDAQQELLDQDPLTKMIKSFSTDVGII